MYVSAPPTRYSLLEALRGGGNERSWREFYEAYAPMLLRLSRACGLRADLADDVVQTTLNAVHQKFKAAPGPWDQSQGRFRNWLAGVARHKIADARRVERRQPVLDPVESGAGRIELDGFEEIYDLEWQRNLLRRALELVRRAVKPTTFQAFDLYVMQGLEPQLVAERLGLAVNAVYIAKHRVLGLLRSIIADLRREEDYP